MWFKNLRLYRFTKPFMLTAEQLNEQLEQQAFYDCPRLQPFSYGWAPPLGRHSTLLTHAANGRILLCARKEEKILPAGVIRDMVQDKAAALEDERMRKVSRRERNMIRDEILQDLMPRALCRSVYTYAYIAPQDGVLVIDVTSQARAEELLGLLRKTLGSLAVVPVSVQQAPAAVMTRWLSERAVPEGFALGGECVLRDIGEEAGIVRCRNQELLGSEIRAHIDAGKQVVRLALQWNGLLSLILDEDMTIKRLRFTDVVEDQVADIAGDDEMARFDNDFAIMTLELARFIPMLVEVFGGIEETDNEPLMKGQVAA
jgi:recombination associated protein RdgC